MMAQTMRRILIAFLIGLVCFSLSLVCRSVISPGPGDLRQALVPAHDLIYSIPPFSHAVTPFYIPSPLTIIPLGLPFIVLPEQFAGALFVGLSCAWLAWHFQQPAWRLLAFLSFPMLLNVAWAQYAPLLMALSLSRLAPLGLLIKPNIALPLSLTFKASRAAWMAALLIVALSFLVFGWWPISWRQQLVPYQGFIPLLTFPGLLLISVLLFRRDRLAWLLVFMAAMPQRAIYDVLALVLIPQSRREMLFVTLIGFLALLSPFDELHREVFFFYLPAWLLLIWPAVRRLVHPHLIAHIDGSRLRI